jgi:hypothetical protein
MDNLQLVFLLISFLKDITALLNERDKFVETVSLERFSYRFFSSTLLKFQFFFGLSTFTF